MGPLNPEAIAALCGSGETKPPLQASERMVLWETQQASVIKLHQGAIDGGVLWCVEPGGFVEKGSTRCT